jgi:hypothetical protein
MTNSDRVIRKGDVITLKPEWLDPGEANLPHMARRVDRVMSTDLKRGMRIEVRGMAMDFSEVWEPAVIGRQPKGGYPVAGYWCIRFGDGSRIAAHVTSFRVVDNR